MRTELKKDEKIVFVTRPHWFTLILPVLYTIAGLVIAFFLSVIFGFFGLLFLIPGFTLHTKLLTGTITSGR